MGRSLLFRREEKAWEAVEGGWREKTSKRCARSSWPAGARAAWTTTCTSFAAAQGWGSALRTGQGPGGCRPPTPGRSAGTSNRIESGRIWPRIFTGSLSDRLPCRTFRRVRPNRPSEARHNARDPQSPDGGPLRNPDRLALSLFVLFIHAVVFGFPVPLNGISRTTRSVAKTRARRDAAGSRRGGVRRDRRGDVLRPPAWIGAERPPRGWAADPRLATSP